MSYTRRRVKLYALNADRQWDDRGTGHVSSVYVERLKGISLVVRAESDGSLLLESKIQPDTAYQKQQDTLIVWSEGDNFDLALSFQEKAGCDEIWEKICHVQGKDPSVEITQEVEESEDERFEEIDPAPPIELPPCEISRLEDISEMIASGLTSPLRKEKLALALESENYIKKLLGVFNKCEQIQNLEALHHLFEIFKNIFLLNKNALFDIMFAEDTIFDVVGCLEYDPSTPRRKKHRQYLMSHAKFREVIPITNRDLLVKIHQTFRVQYIQDVVLPTPSVFEDNMLNTLSSYIFFNKVEIVTLIQEDERYLLDLFSLLTLPDTPDAKRCDTVFFLKEFCNFAQNLQPPGKDSFYKTLLCLGVLSALEMTLAMNDKRTKQASIDILTAVIEYSPTMVREYALDQARTNVSDDNMLINIAINEMLNDTEPELGGAVQLMGVIKMLIDPENMVTSLNKSEKTDFLNLFYKHSMSLIISPLLLNTVGDKPHNEEYHTVQILGLVLELLSFCVEHHTYHVRNCILQKDLLRRILVLMKSSHTFLVLGALRFLRKIIALKDEFYYRHIIKGNLLAPVVDAFIKNNGRYNLLESAILELFEFIKIEDIKSLCTYVVVNFGKTFDEVDYVQTFKTLKLKYEDQQDRLRGDGEEKNLDSLQQHTMRTNRYRRDQRQLEEEEEMWFNEEEDLINEAVTQHKTDLDTTLDFLGKLIDKKTTEAAAAVAAVVHEPRVNNNPIILYNIMESGDRQQSPPSTQQQHQTSSPPHQPSSPQSNNNANNSITINTTNKTSDPAQKDDGILSEYTSDNNILTKSTAVATTTLSSATAAVTTSNTNTTTTTTPSTTNTINTTTTTTTTTSSTNSNKSPSLSSTPSACSAVDWAKDSLPPDSTCTIVNVPTKVTTTTGDGDDIEDDDDVKTSANNGTIVQNENIMCSMKNCSETVAISSSSSVAVSDLDKDKNHKGIGSVDENDWERLDVETTSNVDKLEKKVDEVAKIVVDGKNDVSEVSDNVSLTTIENKGSVEGAAENSLKKGLVDYEGDSDEEDDDEDDDELVNAPNPKKQRLA